MSRKVDTTLASVASDHDLIEALVAEIAQGIDCALSFWMEQIENALHEPQLTTLGRLYAVQAIVQQYRHGTTESGIRVDGYVA